MSGIIGYVGNNNALDVILSGLERLEYRGYDSAGVAFITNKLNIVKVKGRLFNLKNKLDLNTKSNLGIGHTRWATHGIPSTLNSHPHNVGKITIVHNGIIENYEELKKDLNYQFKSDTDTEVAAALLDKLYKDTNDMNKTINIFMEKVMGSYALGIICSDDNNTLYALKKESPLIIGINDNENYIASDMPAILNYTNKYILLDDYEYAKITKDSIQVYKNNKLIKKDIKIFNNNVSSIDKGIYDSYMIKEIHDESNTVINTLAKYIDNGNIKDTIPNLSKYNKIDIVACGSAMHVGYIYKYIIEQYCNIPIDVVVASEYRYKRLFLDNKSLVIVISQSGETADTLAVVKKVNNICDTLGIINVKESSIARTVKNVIYTEAGNEIAVATTKAFVAQEVILSLIALKTNKVNTKLITDYKLLPTYIDKLITNYSDISKYISNKNDVFFIGRNVDYGIALEGALKLKETSYINANAYQAGELKHGPISLIDKGTPVIAIITNKDIATKTISNIKEVKARGAYVILITNQNIEECYDKKITIPYLNDIVNPILAIVPLQIIAYEVAKIRCIDMDKPKNLAKSVTVE